MAEILVVPILSLAATIFFSTMNVRRNRKLDRRSEQEGAERNQGRSSRHSSRGSESPEDLYDSESETTSVTSRRVPVYRKADRKATKREKKHSSRKSPRDVEPLHDVFSLFLNEEQHASSQFHFCNGRVKRLKKFSFFYTRETYYWCKRCCQDVITRLPTGSTPTVDFRAKDNTVCQVKVRYLAQCHGQDAGTFGCKLCRSEGTVTELVNHLARQH
jgi:hypothetical protein